MDSLVDKKTVAGEYTVCTLYLGGDRWSTYVMGPDGIEYRPPVNGEMMARAEHNGLVRKLGAKKND